jgi:hypothetical protein
MQNRTDCFNEAEAPCLGKPEGVPAPAEQAMKQMQPVNMVHRHREHELEPTDRNVGGMAASAENLIVENQSNRVRLCYTRLPFLEALHAARSEPLT